MSSLAGHMLAGYFVGRFGSVADPGVSRSASPPGAAMSGSKRWRAGLIFAAILPDVDYPLAWIFHVRSPIRYTHSLGFCLGLSLFTWAFLRWRKSADTRRRCVQVGAAALSHLVLDGLVGVYANPWFWPLSVHGCKLPFGILPSAGRLDPFNRYLYVNLGIELAILSPLLWMPWVMALKSPVRRVGGLALGFLLWAPFLVWGASLKR